LITTAASAGAKASPSSPAQYHINTCANIRILAGNSTAACIVTGMTTWFCTA
jgi:hypothetical protein